MFNSQLNRIVSVSPCSHIRKGNYILRSIQSKTNTVALKSFKEIPGPSSLPMIGQLHHFLLPRGVFRTLYNSNDLWAQLNKTYGPIVRIDTIFVPKIVIIFDADLAEEVFRRENLLPIRPAFLSYDYFRKYYNKPKGHHLKPSGLVTENGENWKQFRSKVNSAMLDPKTVRNYTNQIDEVACEMVERLRGLRDSNNKFCGEFDKEMSLWSLESIAVVALGRRLNCLKPKKDELVERLIQRTHDIFEVACELDFKPTIWQYYPTKNYKRAMQVYTDIERITKHYLNKTLQNSKIIDNKPEEEKSILEKLLQIDETVAHIMSMDMLLAGIDTTSNSVTATLYLLATNPNVQRKLRENIKSDPNTPYLGACIKESMRMMPVIGLNMRKITRDYEIMGYHVPKGTLLSICHQHMMMTEKYFPRPNDFIPERWLDNRNKEITTTHKFAFLPFGFGTRSCIGQRFANLEMKIFLSRLIQHFEIDWYGETPKVDTTHINRLISPNNFILKDIK